MKQRLLTSAIGLIAFFAVLFANEIVFSIAVLLVSAIAICELHSAIDADKKMTAVGLIVCAVIFSATVTGNLLTALIVCFGIYMLLSVLLFGKIPVSKLYMLGFASIVFSVSFSTLAVIRIEYNVVAVLLPFVFAWITDSGAYLFGMMLGKHKLAPALSPKKTIEGSVGGMALCILISLFYLWLSENCFNTVLIESDAYIKMLGISFAASVVSQFGDLALSAIKREYGIKDYGNILPGHGGVLDRFDSLIFVAPFVYFVLQVL